VISADDQFTLWVNGREAGNSGGQADAWREPVIVDLTRHLVPGDNVVAVEARNTGGPAGLIARVVVDLAGRESVVVATDGQWKEGPDGGDAAAPRRRPLARRL
jgi:alpha-L-rhamnosidase